MMSAAAATASMHSPEVDDAALITREAKARKREGLQRFIDRCVLTLVIVGVWEAVVELGYVRPFFISRPSLIAGDIFNLFASGYIFPHLAITLYEFIAGLVIGTVLGVATGFCAALSKRVAEAIQPLLVAFSSMPRVAIAPLFVIWFGFGPSSKIALAAMVVYFVVFFNTFSGMRSVDPVLMNNVKVMGASNSQILWMVSLPQTIPWIIAAINTSISLALIGAVVGEFVGSTAGVGWIMVQATGTLDTTRLFSTMIILAVLGALIFALTRYVEERLLRWRPRNEF